MRTLSIGWRFITAIGTMAIVLVAVANTAGADPLASADASSRTASISSASKGATCPDRWDSRPTIKLGSKSDCVRVMQVCLSYVDKQHNLGSGSLSHDGSFGPITQSWVKKFQSYEGLTSDGIVGKNTWSMEWAACSM